MHVLQIASLAGPGAQAGGVWSVATAQIAILRRAGADVSCLAGWLGPLPKDRATTGADTLVQLFQPLPGQGIRGLVPLGLRRKLHALAHESDVVHVHLARDFVTTLSLVLLWRKKTAVVAQPHGMIRTPSKRLTRVFDSFFRQSYLKRVDTWLALTLEEENELVRYGVPPDRIKRITNSVPEPSQIWAPQRKALIVFVARLHACKQPDVFVEACIALLRQGYEFDIVVAGPDQGMLNKLKDAVENSGFEERFSFPGALTNCEVLDLYARAWFAVTPSIHEVFPMSVIEAASVGCPVGLSNQTGISQLMAEKEAALLFDPRSTSVEKSIARVLNDAGLRAQLSMKGRQLYVEAWAPEKLLSQLSHIYNSAVAQKNAIEPL